MKLQESAGVSFSLSFLLQVLTAIALGVWGFSQLDARISELAQASLAHKQSIERIEINMEKNQDAPIPSDHIQNTKIYFLEAEHAEVRKRLETIENRIYESRR